MSELPEELRGDMRRAQRIERWTLFWMGGIVVVMYFAMGSSQAMKTALFEDVLGLLPAMTFLIAARLEPKEPTEKFPYGFVRVNSLAFLAAAVVLALMGAFLFYDSLRTLLAADHPPVGPVEIFGHTVWQGWVMIAALAYSVVPPVILGRIKAPLAERLRDKVLHTDGLMQKADWQTGVAAIAGIMGIALGFWWADAAAAAFISISILRDGIANMRTAAAELIDGTPRELAGQGTSGDAAAIRKKLQSRWPEGRVRLRESGRYILASIDGVRPPAVLPSLADISTPEAPPWRLTRLTFSPPDGPGEDDEQTGASERDRDETS